MDKNKKEETDHEGEIGEEKKKEIWEGRQIEIKLI